MLPYRSHGESGHRPLRSPYVGRAQHLGAAASEMRASKAAHVLQPLSRTAVVPIVRSSPKRRINSIRSPLFLNHGEPIGAGPPLGDPLWYPSAPLLLNRVQPDSAH